MSNFIQNILSCFQLKSLYNSITTNPPSTLRTNTRNFTATMSDSSTSDGPLGTPVEPQTPPITEDLNITTSLEDLQTDEQRRVLDTVAQVRKCGLESILSLPQLVVCGDQSAGKSSVLEALTEIPFPRSDNRCTRFATEISLRRAPVNSLTIKVIPDE